MQELLRYLHEADPFLLCGLGFFVGLGLGHWLQLGRDRRAEFNRITEPVFDALVAQRDDAAHNSYRRVVAIPDERFAAHFDVLRRRRFTACMRRYREALGRAQSQYDDRSGVWRTAPADRDAVVSAIADLLRLLKPR